jgi:DNA-binding response OmpR family regulator
MTSSILFLGENAGAAPAVIHSLTAAGFAVENAGDLRSVGTLTGTAFDLVLLDIMLPLQRGLEVCRELYERGMRAPILMLNGRTGGHLSDLLTRVRVLLSATRDSGITALAEYRFGEVHVDFMSGVVTRKGMPVKVSSKELQLLRYLISWRGSVLSRQELLTAVWRYRAGATRTLDVHIAALRGKLEERPHQPRYIRTVRGQGYVFTAAASDKSPTDPFAQLEGNGTATGGGQGSY